jgi:threonine dehydrogenase-like Zn-dependent dehydrogenase
MPTLFFRQLHLVGSSMANHAQFARAATWVTTGGAKAQVSKVFDFADLPKALELLDAGEQVGKVVIRHPE